MIPSIRLLSQQLAKTQFQSPKELVSWMGAVQAQEYNMVKWALGVRLNSATIQDIEKALHDGDILRTHVMRPTWHLVPAEDIRWMLKLSADRIKSACESSILEISKKLYTKCNSLIEKILEGNKSLTRLEIADELTKAGIVVDSLRMNRFMMNAEVEGIVCSGIDKGRKPTYTLLEERVPPAKELHKEEALAKLAIRYFQSHSPASLNDFVWWSGLSITEARHALHLIGSELIEDRFESEKLFIHKSYNEDFKSDEVLHLLPSFDEYLISYKDRKSVLDLQHYPRAFTNNGIFYPIIIYNGRVVGAWKKTVKKGEIVVDISFFEKCNISKELLEAAINRYKAFLSQPPIL